MLAIGTGLLAVWWEHYHQGTSQALFPFLSPVERILVASRAVWFYLSKLIWPTNLTFIHPRWNIDPRDVLSYVWLVAGAALCAVIYFVRRYWGRGVEVAAVFFVATLSPVIGFIMLFTFLYTFVANHYQYLACIGPIALASAGLGHGGFQAQSNPRIGLWHGALRHRDVGGADLATKRDVRQY